MRPRLLSVTSSMLLVVGCTTAPEEELSMAPTAPASAAATQIGAAPPDLSGAWTWSREEHLTMPAWVAQLVVGINPEGPVTQATCTGSGTMTLAQNGSTFSGTAMQTAHGCVTSGGQQFQSPGFSDPILVTDGVITGRAVRLSFSEPTVTPCPHHATIREVDGGVAIALSGSGRCFVPGHPKSESPIVLEPPPGGTSKTLRWSAVRP